MNIQRLRQERLWRFRAFYKYVIPVVLVAVALQYTVYSVLGVRQKVNTINEQVDVQLSSVDSRKADASYLELYREKLWLEIRYLVAKTDSISLSVNLKDSLLQLELKGVVLKTVKILDFEADQFFHQLTPGAYHHLFATQTQSFVGFSTIPKEAFIIKKAPRDTASVETKPNEIEPARHEDVHWVMMLNNGVVLKTAGTDRYVHTSRWPGRKFWFVQDLKKMLLAFAQTIRFKTPEYHPEIRLVISSEDAKAIYRALPVHPLVCTRL